MDSTEEWLLFIPQVSAASSKLRAMFARRLQGIGAVQLQTNLWLLPYTPEHEKLIITIITELERYGGSGFFFRSQAGKSEMQQRLIVHFQILQHQEYMTFMRSCQEFLTRIEQPALNNDWSFDILEENERALHKLTTWLPKLQRRDFFPDEHSAQARTLYEQCSQALYELAITVYTYHNTHASPDQTTTSEKAENES
ncbi:Chromate resistance protein ChrB [Dictyobacter kobayashii]|uniref:ChrB N-terminal domain-containing protein n=1 Tax=Dictyobacter kobayashii TaxID=2014872 RepID=A0A402AXP9_9CHLR|nr:Chromate resistance protein ChrB [Dictyobacter kobayashii]GCE23877.1 hypothetical protein KDK_76770 [Dictyobacter kobayashii]